MVKDILEQPADTLRRTAPLALGTIFIWLLWSFAKDLDWHAVHTSFDAIPRWRWMAATVATLISFWAVAQYDVIAHRHFRTGISGDAARRAGGAAIAVGQTTGFGPLVGGTIRWRLMPAIGHKTAAKITGFVTLGFFTAWAILTTSVAVPILVGALWLVPILLPIVGGIVAAALLLYPKHKLFRLTFTVPSLPAMAQMTVLAGCDLVFAGLALYLLLPPDMAPPLVPLIAAFSIALGAGMISGTPGGVGPFEMALISLIPNSDMAPLAAALIAFRLIYYAVPCLIGMAYSGLAPVATPVSDRQTQPGHRGPRAEHQITAQARCQNISAAESTATLLDTPQSLTLFLGATSGPLFPLLRGLHKRAKSQNRCAALYKITPRDAVVAREAGWTVAALAHEAVITPKSYSETGPNRRQLRRFLRKADKAGVRFERLAAPDWGRMADIHHDWELAHGAERGLTMGRFCPLYLRDKPLFGAFDGETLIAFASLLESPGFLSLDVMRHVSDLPTGTMHGLVHHMICDAQQNSQQEFNLAAVPHPKLVQSLRLNPGLTRFKASFGPSWRPLYFASPNRWSMVVSALDLWLAITRPRPIPYHPMDAWHIDAMLTDEIPTPPIEKDLRLTG